MDGKELEEVKNIAEHASHGNWFPFAIVCGCMGLCVVLFIYILKLKEKVNNDKHNNTDAILNKLADNGTAMNLIIAVHETEIQNLKK